MMFIYTVKFICKKMEIFERIKEKLKVLSSSYFSLCTDLWFRSNETIPSNELARYHSIDTATYLDRRNKLIISRSQLFF